MASAASPCEKTLWFFEWPLCVFPLPISARKLLGLKTHLLVMDNSSDNSVAGNSMLIINDGLLAVCSELLTSNAFPAVSTFAQTPGQFAAYAGECQNACGNRAA